MSRYWTSWHEPLDESQDYRPLKDPPQVVDWWCTGYTGDMGEAILCAVVDVDDPDFDHDKLVNLLEGYWKPCRERLIESKADAWLPPADRFPR